MKSANFEPLKWCLFRRRIFLAPWSAPSCRARQDKPGRRYLALQMGKFVDLCPSDFTFEHLSEIKVFRLLEVSQKQRYMGREVTQISGTAFFDKEELKEFLKRAEDFLQKDHLLLGAELDLFSAIEDTLSGMHAVRN